MSRRQERADAVQEQIKRLWDAVAHERELREVSEKATALALELSTTKNRGMVTTVVALLTIVVMVAGYLFTRGHP